MQNAIIVYWGPVASWKSTAAASYPLPMDWFSFDIGGFQRARIPNGADINLHEYPAPIKLDITRKRAGLEGWLELWSDFLKDMMTFLKSDRQTAVIDTGTRWWLACHRAYLEQKQNLARERNQPVPEGLLQIEYGEVNPWAMQVLDACKQQGKFLIFTAHETEERMDVVVKGQKESVVVMEGNKPVMRPEGWRHLNKNADMVIHLESRAGVPWGIVEKSGLVTMKLEHAQIREPSHDRLTQVLDTAYALENNGLAPAGGWPGVWEE